MSAEFRQSLVVTQGSLAKDISQTLNVYNKDRIGDHRYNFGSLVSYHTKDFVGRAELFTELDHFARHPCGYFAVTGTSGLGKTAIAAEIARRYQAPSFFASAQENRTTAAQCLNHLCADLIERFKLQETYPYLPPRSETDSGFFSELLDTISSAHAPLWLVIDALDEADPLAGRNPFLLPARLPPGVFIVVTYRPNSITFNVAPDTPSYEFPIDSDAAMQTRDIETFLLRRFGADHDLRSKLAAAADGSFLYLTFLLAEIAEGSLAVDAILTGKLPKGLEAYYEQGWQLAGSSDVAPVALLCAAREPLPAIWLSGILKITPAELQTALRTWRRFLAQNNGDWRVVHKSFADFASARLSLAEAHGAIAAWLNGPEHWHEPYSSRHLTAHLMFDPDALFGLVRDSRWFDLQHQYDKTGLSYLADLERAAQAAQRSNAAAAERDRELPYLPEEAWCAVRHAVLSQVLPSFILRNMCDFFPSDLLPLSAALNLIENSPTDFYAIAGIGKILEAHGATPSVFDRLLDAVGGIEDERRRAEALRDLIRHAPPDRVARIFEASASVTQPSVVLALLPSLISNSRKPWRLQAQHAMLGRIDAIECRHCGAWLSSLAAPFLEAELRERVLCGAVARARALPSALYRSWTLAQLAAASDYPIRETLVREAFHSAQAVAHPDLELRARLEVLEALGRTKPLEDRDRELALDLCRQVPCEHCRAVLAACIASMLTKLNREEAAAQALAALGEIADDGTREGAAAEVHRFLELVRWPARRSSPTPQFSADERRLREIAQTSLREATRVEERCDALLLLARCTREPERSDALRAALAAVLEASHQRPPKTDSARSRKRLRVRRRSADPELHVVQEYSGLPKGTLAAALTDLRAMMGARYPLPSGLCEPELLEHARLPWDSDLMGPSLGPGLAMLNFDRLSYVKNLCDLYRRASEAERAEIVEVSRALIAQMSDSQNKLLAEVFLARTRAEASSIQTAIDSLSKIVFAAYRAEAHLLLYPFARPDQQAALLKAAFLAALRSHEGVRRACLIQIAGPLSRLPRRELYQLWREVLRQMKLLDDHAPDGSEPVAELLTLIFPILTAMASENAANQVLQAAESAATSRNPSARMR